jgi:hypothetical protein
VIIQWPRSLVGVLAMLGVVGVTGCGLPTAPATTAPLPSSAPATPKPTLPVRPMSLPLTNANPCDLLTPAQRGQLKISNWLAGVNNDGQGSRDCTWDNDGGPPENGWVIRFDLQHDASYYLGSTTGAQVAQVGGFPAVQSSSAFVDPKIECILVVDVAPGENLQASYQNLRGDYPGINHQVACQLADQVAEMAVKNLRRLAG